MIEGKRVTINGREYVVPELTMRAARRVSAIVKEIDNVDVASAGIEGSVLWLDAHVRGIVELLRGNYPDLTPGDLDDLTTRSVATTFLEVMRAAGHDASQTGEAVSP